MRLLSPSEISTAYAVLSQRLAANSGITIVDRSLLRLHVGGDSVAAGSFANCNYGTLYGPNAARPVVGHVSAITGSKLADEIARMRTGICKNATGDVYVLGMGINDFFNSAGMSGLTAAQYMANLGGFMKSLKTSERFRRLIIATVTPSLENQVNFWRNQTNPIGRDPAFLAAYDIDGCADFAADATMGPDAAASDASLYGDGTHPTTLGQHNLEAIFRPVADAAFAGL